jgi:AraC family transcriptional regulator
MIALHQLSDGSNLSLRMPSNKARMLVTVGGGRGCSLTTEDPMVGVWLPLRGRLQLSTGDSESFLIPGDLRVTELDHSVKAIGRGNALWMSLMGGEEAWRDALAQTRRAGPPGALPLPAWYAADRALRRHAIAFLRSALAESNTHPNSIIDAVLELEATFDPAIARCPGRTLAQRRQVFLRLQRIRNFISANSHLELDNRCLAQMSNYSLWQFIRTFREAYEETPHAYLISQRLKHARDLLRTSALSIHEVVRVCGFDSRCAFSRLFHQRFGASPRAWRESNGSCRRPADAMAVSESRPGRRSFPQYISPGEPNRDFAARDARRLDDAAIKFPDRLFPVQDNA